MIIILMGYMASGKSIVGRILASKLNYDFIDLDDYIEEIEGRTISNIFKSSGEIYFRKIETKCLNEILRFDKNFVLSVGGGTPCYGNNIELIKTNKNVISFFLKATINTIVSRLENEKSKRPIVSRFKTNDDLNEFIGKHLFERNQYYHEANYIIPSDETSVGEIVEDIVLKLF